MFKSAFDLFRSMLILLLIFLFLCPGDLRAAQHVIGDEELRKAITEAKELRKDHLRQIRDFLSLPESQRILKKSSIDTNKLQQATAQLSDEELARLAARSQEVQNDFAAGHLSHRELTILVIALAFAILIVAVAK